MLSSWTARTPLSRPLASLQGQHVQLPRSHDSRHLIRSKAEAETNTKTAREVKRARNAQDHENMKHVRGNVFDQKCGVQSLASGSPTSLIVLELFMILGKHYTRPSFLLYHVQELLLLQSVVAHYVLLF